MAILAGVFCVYAWVASLITAWGIRLTFNFARKGGYTGVEDYRSPVLGVTLITLLFIGSTRFTEKISLGKYPEYAEYQKRISAVIPWFREK